MITMENDVIEVPVNADDAAILEGIIANDAEDGDLTQRLIIENMSRFISKGKRSAKIGVVDSDDNVTEVTREVIYTDYQSPKFSLVSPLIFPVGTSKLDGVIMAQDMIDGNITGKIRLKTDTADFGERDGRYSVTFICSNSLGDSSELPVTITFDNSIADSSYPKINLSDYLVYVKKDTYVDPWAYVTSLKADGHTYDKSTENDRAILTGDNKDVEEKDFDIQYGGLNSSVPGIYEVFYSYTDSQYRTGRSCLIVVVEAD